ncbi:MAG: YceI family protein [Flavipsychrobacter sp.]|nr:YceI family protein [Flavipsychrobacter sp.]
MKKLFILSAMVLGLGLVANAQAPAKKTASNALVLTPGKWNVDPAHSGVKFSVSHMTVSEVDGSFKVFNGTIVSPTADFNNATVNFTVDVTSVNTDNDMRDKHLKSDDFFNAEKYPSMTFTSTSFKKVKGNIYSLEGNLTIRDVTKKTKFAVLYGGAAKDPYGNTKAGFKASTKISREAFGLKWNKLTEAGGAMVGDEVSIVLNLEFAQAKS